MEELVNFLKKLIPRKLFTLLRPVYHFLLAFFAAVFYGFPSRRIRVIGVTGTKGKTTVVELLHETLSGSGVKVASASSLRFRIGDEETVNDKKMTMPGRMFAQKFLHEAVRAGCKYAVLEVTSEGIKQFRHRFIRFSAAVMTNVSPEHIESHGGFENYLRAKLDLFWRLKKNAVAVLNRDDPNGVRFSAATSAHKVFYGKEGVIMNGRNVKAQDLILSDSGVEFYLNGNGIFSYLPGEFNFYNILAAVAVGLSEHIALEKIAEAVGRVKLIPGRMEFVQREPFAVVIDYAHTPDSLRRVYSFFRKSNSKFKIKNSKLICVLGSAGGGRDKWKRSEMGKIAAEFCDEVILTNEDPYDENPATILDEIETGFSQSTKRRAQSAKKILDRREAIREALKLAQPGDTVIITGKGAEKWIVSAGGVKIPWDEKSVVVEELKKI